MDGVHPCRSAAARVENYCEFDAFGFDHLLHLKDRYSASQEGFPRGVSTMAEGFAVAVQEGLVQEGSVQGGEKVTENKDQDGRQGSVGDNGSPRGNSGDEIVLGKEVKVPQGLSSGSTISNLDTQLLEEGEGKPGSEVWKAKKMELLNCLKKAKERQKVLAQQLALQQERFRLEAQEKENQKLEWEIKHNEDRWASQENEQARCEKWEELVTRLEREREERELQFRVEQAELKARLEEREARVSHELEMESICREVGDKHAQVREVPDVGHTGGGPGA